MACLVSHKHKYVFVHIPKTGGTSVSRILSTVHRKNVVVLAHCTIRDLRLEYGFSKSYFKFCVVRNPWDRLVSHYFHLLPLKTRKGTAFRKYLKSKNLHNFRDFVLSGLRKIPLTDERSGHRLFAPQCMWIKGKHRLLVHYVARFESIREDFAFICGRLGLRDLVLPHMRRSKHEYYKSYYDDRMVNEVAEVYQQDITSFGYDY